jgi:hypothetical protein
MPRSRGALSGLLLVLLGAWGALIPFFGPNINWAFSGDPAWTWTTAKGWLEVLPGVVAVVGGLILLFAGNRASAVLGGWLAVLAGAWFVVDRTFAPTLRIGDVGQPVAASDLKRALLEVTYFTGLGVLIVFLGAAALARAAVRHARDVVVAEPAPVAATGPAYVPGEGAAAREPANYDETGAGTDPVAAAPERGGRGGLFRRHHHAGV